MEANYKFIWGGADTDYDFDCEIDDHQWYRVYVREDCGLSFGDFLMISGSHKVRKRLGACWIGSSSTGPCGFMASEWPWRAD
jgi:hypothetical protein